MGHVAARLKGADFAHVWSRSMPVAANVSGFRLVGDASGDVLVAHENAERLHVEKLAGADGTTLWTAEPVAEDSEGTGVAVLPGGDAIVAGLARDASMALQPVLLRLGSADGAVVWERRYAVTGSGAVSDAVDVTPGGDVFLTGSVQGTVDLGGTTVSGEAQLFAALVSAGGDVVWAKDACMLAYCYGGLFALRTRAAEDAVIAGSVLTQAFSTDTDVMLQYLAVSDGTMLSPTILRSPSGDVAGDVDVGAGTTYVTGRVGWEIQPGTPSAYGSVFVLAL